MFELAETVTVISVQSVLGREPDKTAIVLHDFRDACLRDSLGTSEPGKSHVIPVGHLDANDLRIDSDLPDGLPLGAEREQHQGKRERGAHASPVSIEAS